MEPVASYVESNLKTLKGLLTAEDVNEIVINPDGAIFVEYSGSAYMEATTDFALSDEDIHAIGYNLAGETKNTLGEQQPIVSGRVHLFGHDVRVQVVIPPAIEAGVSISIRKFVNRTLSVDEISFVAGKPIDVNKQRHDEQEHLLELAAEGRLAELLTDAIEKKLNILISGGTSSGKTTVARALLSLTHPDERIITIEDAVELRPENTNKVSLVAERVAGSNRTAARLLESSLRMRPDRLILGEIRGAEAYNFLEAINTGHPGSISTIHADSPALALERMALMVMQTGVPLSRHDVIEYASATIDMIIQVGRRDGKRGVLEILMPQLSKQ
ncbi:P-type DNA transfer ATPase VirB11 [Roseibium suaedae]|uniref:Type IV secretion system protein n=1 Tax=Roseibium suaedae TaxID=735517 RepID=A0A1M7PJM6_9HYPH|nr:P-type DNA transfer ATPase VirB11 [Roseibium suaedae]SHN17404.1 type IV secretion system protein VirB11 [Roseibium suaedae]